MTDVLFNMMLGRGRGGLERAAAHYHHALASRGYKVVTIGHAKGWMRTQLAADALFLPLAPFTEYDFRAHMTLQGAIRTHAPIAVLAHGNRAMRYASRLAGADRIGVLHNTRFKPATGRLDACIAVTQGLAHAARIHYSGMNVDVVPNLLDLTADGVRPPRREPIVIGALGRLHVDKGFDHLIEALSQAPLVQRNWRLVIAGEGPEQSFLAALATRRGRSARLDFVGWVEDRSAFFRSIDLLCMPSRSEAFGMVLIEALGHAVPVVTTDNAGSHEIILPNRHALVVPIGDPGRLAAAIEMLLADAEFAASIGRAGRAHVLANFTFPVVSDILDHVVRRLARLSPVGAVAAVELRNRPAAPLAPG